MPIYFFSKVYLANGFSYLLIPFTCAVFVTISSLVLLHEFGHALMARYFGIRTRDISLFALGGVARMERIQTPIQELLIAFAGPLVNLSLAAVAALTMYLIGYDLWIPEEGNYRHLFLNFALVGNLILGLFNLLPAFPMDGGRILRSLLALFLGHALATRIAGGLGQLFALAFCVYSIWKQEYIYVLLGGFVFMSASSAISHLGENDADVSNDEPNLKESQVEGSLVQSSNAKEHQDRDSTIGDSPGVDG